MKGLSAKEIELIAGLEYDERHYFTRDDIRHHFDRDSQMRHTIHKLLKKGRIISLNRNRYYLVPLKAKSGVWADDPFILADEICDSRDYFIGGWAAANYWRLTDQVPMKIEIFTTRRQGIRKILNTTYIFRRTTKNCIRNSVSVQLKGHRIRMQAKDASGRWAGSGSCQQKRSISSQQRKDSIER